MLTVGSLFSGAGLCDSAFTGRALHINGSARLIRFAGRFLRHAGRTFPYMEMFRR